MYTNVTQSLYFKGKLTEEKNNFKAIRFNFFFNSSFIIVYLPIFRQISYGKTAQVEENLQRKCANVRQTHYLSFLFTIGQVSLTSSFVQSPVVSFRGEVTLPVLAQLDTLIRKWLANRRGNFNLILLRKVKESLM